MIREEKNTYKFQKGRTVALRSGRQPPGRGFESGLKVLQGFK